MKYLEIPLSLLKPSMLKFRIFTLLFFLLDFAAIGQTVNGDRPNIIVILADDLGYSDIGCFGGEINTPNLDQLAQTGLRFTSFYNAARCCPSRASLLTGVYPHEAGMGGMVSSDTSTPELGAYQGFLNQNSVTLAEVLKQVGYKTYMSGKWHVGERREHWPLKRGFDQYFGLISGANSYFEMESSERYMVHQDELWYPPADGFYMTDAFTDTAVAYLNKHEIRDNDSPFFLYLAYTAPHWPLHAMEEDIRRYDGFYDSGWDELRKQRYQRMKKLGIIDQRYDLSPRPNHIPNWESLSEENSRDWADRMEVYAAMVDRMDQGIGKVISTLRRQGKLENTLIIFLSDNGASPENVDGRKLNDPKFKVGQKGSYLSYDEVWANASNTPYTKYKAWTQEGGIRTPFIVHWPQVIKGASSPVSDAVGHIVDIMATCLDVSGARYPTEFNGHNIAKLRGRSLVPAFKGKKTEDRILFWEHFGRWAVREGSWKLIGGSKAEKTQLYDLSKDPVELNDLSQKYPLVLEEMRGKYQFWADEIGVKN